LTKAQLVSAKSWQTRRLGGLRIQNTPSALAYWQAIAHMGGFRSYLTEREGQPIAFVLGVQWNGRFIYEEPGYDPAFADLSPGMVILLRAIEELYARNTPKVFDFGFGHAEYKQILGSRMSQSGPVLLIRRGWKPAAVMGMERLRREAGAAARAMLRDSGLLETVRRMYRR
jgi:CelD/BcsL family acetyltransferase involved in cellulose biosynthesis